MKKQKALVFFSYLAPWRIDVFNEMASYYENMTIALYSNGKGGFMYDTNDLKSKLRSNIKIVSLNACFYVGRRYIQLGLGLRKLLKQENPDVIYAHEYSPICARLIFYKKIGLFEYEYYVTSSDNVLMANASSGLKAMSRDFIVINSNGAVLYSEAVKNWYQDRFPNIKVEICPNIQNPKTLLKYRSRFTDIAQKYISKFDLNNSNIILSVSRLTDVKGLDLLIRAFAKANLVNYKLVIVGMGEKEQKLRSLAKDLCVKDKVIFAGFYTGAELYAWYDIANFFILPSRYEPFGAVVNEALIYGCPVVISKYIGALEFVDNSNGIIFDPLNENEFVDVLICASNKYEAPNSQRREDLMICKFEDYVGSFDIIRNK